MTPQEWRDLIASELGPDSCGGTWRCGALAETLYRILSLQGRNPTLIRGAGNGYGHCWVKMPDGTILDPSQEQYEGAVSVTIGIGG
jgi:hypothetical protein